MVTGSNTNISREHETMLEKKGETDEVLPPLICEY
jgi:hypothetical protein